MFSESTYLVALSTVEAVQSLSGANFLMYAFSFLGTELFYMLLIPFLFWCVSPEKAARLLFLLIVSSHINAVFKIFFHEPRPFWMSDKVKPGQWEASYGIPSGHAQNAVSVWGYVTHLFHSKRLLLLVIVLIFGIAYSRLALGVHFPQDIIGGYVLGFIILFLFTRYGKVWHDWFVGEKLSIQIGFGFLLSIIGLVLGHAAVYFAQSFVDPASWSEMALSSFPKESFEPRSLDSIYNTAGSILGAAVGYALYYRGRQIKTDDAWLLKILRLILGLALFLALRVTLSKLFPTEGETALVGRYIRYAILVIYASWIAPWIFLQIRFPTKGFYLARPKNA